MSESYWGLLWSSFIRILGPFGSLIAIALAFTFWYFLPGQTVQLAVALPILIVLLMLIMTLFDTSRKMNGIRLPRIIMSQKEQNSDYLSCILEPSELFSENIAVSFYYAPPNSFERLIGVGQVDLIRTDKKIQVKLVKPVEVYEEIINGLINNNENIRRNVYIKPSIPLSYLGNGG